MNINLKEAYIKLIKEKFIQELEEQVWRKEMSIAFDLSKIPEIEKIRDGWFKELDRFKEDLKRLDPSDTTKLTRTKRKELENQISKAEDLALQCDETITMIRDNTNKEKEKVDQLEIRIKFAEKYGIVKN